MQNFNFHSHTYRCGHADLDYTDEEYVQDYIKMGFKKIAFTDHAPEKNKIDKRDKIRMEYSERTEYLNSIKALKEKYKDIIEIESGYEVEYLPGEEENLMELKKETDKLILGQHFVYDDDKNLKILKKGGCEDQDIKNYAKYLNKAMELKIPDIIAHPDIFMSGRENMGSLETEVSNEICMSAEKYNIPLEINLNNIFVKTYYENRTLNNQPIEEQRKKLKNVLYPCKEFWQIASNYNIKILYGLDTHHRGHIQRYKELVELATEIIGEDIINKLNFIKNIGE